VVRGRSEPPELGEVDDVLDDHRFGDLRDVGPDPANPTPVEPPVITAVLPVRSAIIMSFARSGLPGQELALPGNVFHR
jgi:hypothetical protein